ncbi:hypothetical protein K438DRAFT_1847896 [Mycena galopus ATCC 62051]|nr:hypothetical protein K438DRAFT_1690634 [Mycena galopus ATCC 62051]KAF8175530.1 hypothetical protein K438DRAFT_1847896 [Mycena galopus ATCC 62051]
MYQGTSTPESLEKVDDLWFTTDTIIIIRAENKIFRVPGGILAARSAVFRDMFAFPQPQSGEDQMDGCPVVRLGDSAADVEVFLRAILDSSYFMPAPAPNYLSVVLGILRLSHKYDVQYLYRRALEHLNLDGWYYTTYDEDCPEHLDNGLPEFSPLYPLQVIRTATEVGARWLLPATYYHLSTYSSEELLPFLEGSFGPDVVKALAAHTHLVRAAVTTHDFLTNYSSCLAPNACDLARSITLRAFLTGLSSPALQPFPRDLIGDVMVELEENGMCSECRESAKTRMHEAASAFWDEIPGIFGLPPWNELHAMKRVAMGETEDRDDAD